MFVFHVDTDLFYETENVRSRGMFAAIRRRERQKP
jgi:hypothetical protein